ncbi:ethanolamine ammonia-lyase subunit EutC [Pseudomonas sp. S31]|uniref:ethanolamine ammonia-lyase subunit EutC n=1 Tax=Pseudomonas sp. S31 TaxID=1564473 RepID=UPI001912C445|nr:ethanolamine ammonia-lyase subunit EutC [Pseudomonas sp. S31]MBK4999951.1 ethanolamine ammonia-lyase subunit EutC [Pseudomonas sp. S31]
MSKSPATQNQWQHLRSHTPARIALGRAGTSLPTDPLLDFQFAHALARDAVHTALDTQTIATNLQQLGLDSLKLKSAATDRDTYLQRPDLGRKLHEESDVFLRNYACERKEAFDVAIVVADGLSALAIQRHTVPFLQRLKASFNEEGWTVAPVCFVQQGRVAVADQVGEILNAKMTVILIGERPGLSSPDSLGLYFTYGPRVGLTDASRNCISNVRLEGLPYGTAAFRLMYLMREACKRQLSGVDLKDEAEIPTLDGPSAGNFLLDNF